MKIFISFFSVIVITFSVILFLDLEPKQPNLKIQKPFTHNKIQELSKYYFEYQKTNIIDREAIKAIIVTRFDNFNETTIKNKILKQFLINAKGY